MNRRDAVYALLALGAAISPLRAPAQVKGDKPFRIVTLPGLFPEFRSWFVDPMRDLGLIEGRDFIIAESGFQYGGLHLDEAARRVVAAKPDLILTLSPSFSRQSEWWPAGLDVRGHRQEGRVKALPR